MDVKLSGKAAEAAVNLASFEPEGATADPIWSLPDVLPLYDFTKRVVLFL